MKKVLFVFAVLISGIVSGQDAWKKIYRSFPTKINDLVHTRLDARFDYNRSYLNGKVWLTLKPHFYATDSLQLDAKGMNIHKVELVRAGKNIPLKYQYVDSLVLQIKLDRTYKKDENYVVYIDYTAKPDEFKTEGSAAISDAKGLYFINPKGEEKDKPTQIWTQGETEASSVWIPTIDKTNQKTTQEFMLTVPAKYVTLSNGKMTAQKKNTDGTRTDTWVMELPHAPYLFFIGVGDFAVVKDSYKGKEVNYYVEKSYEKVARKIFGLTPEMMKFFSEKVTGVEFPWVKYSQMVGRDYVSGAMENTTATLHQESAQQNARELIDGNSWEGTIAHELFHQWFGDYVTAESWSNLTVNESFADYSQLLWLEYKYGADEAGFENYKEMQNYLGSAESRSKDLVRFFYRDKEDMFDLVSYQKGGRILHMLRNYVGDEAFFKSLNKYLTTNKFGNGNAHKLRLAFEEVTGKDLNWFFNQWYFGSGHPKLEISYGYDVPTQTASVYIKQTQPGDKLFKLPVSIEVYHGNSKKRYTVWAENAADTFSFSVASKPDLINVDADKVLLAEKKDTKTLSEWIHQYTYAGKYLDRRDAIDFAARNTSDPAAYDLLLKALGDPFYNIRIRAILGLGNAKPDAATIGKIETIAKSDKHAVVRSIAIDALAKQKNEAYKDFFTKATSDSSYSVAGAALEALGLLDGKQAFAIANTLSKEDNKGRLLTAITNVIIKYGDESVFDFVTGNFEDMPLSQAKFAAINPLADFLSKVTDLERFKKGVDIIVKFRDEIPASIRPQTDAYINGMALKGLADKKEAAGAKEMADYVRSKISGGK
ncbi:MAG: M1 family metallopeptidase [Chitinophagaceae bacterium]|nr:M1 family metallopeptidase [Chitinophagaceae bacterium]MCA6454223.1 M1 family metallopeptidase [Chitinophagaceae bacterium]MCA6458046.1 M1 family metallopeptidase [Chitinophagaceae bacterium]MCA6463759.1 M1 family metallopeptidase [Chitinophagaceae bacterium]